MFNNNETSMDKLAKRIHFQKVHNLRNKNNLDKFRGYQASRTRKDQEADRKRILTEINNLEKRTITKKEKLAEIENALIRFKGKSKVAVRNRQRNQEQVIT